ncbi:MAG: hypothetical protein H6873_00240 [Hyphomicrobiaceae bacterium]|nr:hypothetical protein [Hyphomicrobiaceae bacterium]
MTHSVKISTLWIVVLMNLIFADVLSFMYPSALAEISTGTVEGVVITPLFLLIAAVLTEIPIAMIFLSRSLGRPLGRIANLVAVVVTILFVVGGGSLKLHYLFLAGVEVIAMVYIAWLAWTWPKD